MDAFDENKKIISKKEAFVILASAISIAIGLYIEFIYENPIAQAFFLIAAALSGKDIFRKGISSILRKKFSINFLITIAAIGAFAIGHGEEGAAVVFLFYIAEFLENYASERAKKSISALLHLAPETAVVKRRGKEERVRVEDLKIGDVVIIRPGDKIPADGVVCKGSSSIDQSAITGESIPVHKKEGDTLFAGTINMEGYIEMKVSKDIENSVLSKIIDLVKEAQKKKSKNEIFIERFSSYYTPLVIVLSVLVAVLPVALFGANPEEWIYRALVLLVVSCPCALAISTPVSIVSALTSGAKNGVLIKGGNYIEEIRNAKVVVFDKTGTLTEGRPVVTEIVPLNDYTEKEIISIAASLEKKSSHPLAEPIAALAAEKGAEIRKVSGFKSTSGKGVEGRIGERAFYVGSKSFLEKTGIRIPDEAEKRLLNSAETAVFVGNEKEAIGMILLMDKVRDCSKDVIAKLRKMGIKTFMLTGDNERVAKKVSEMTGIDGYFANLLPDDKVKTIEELLKEYDHVVMVGDGVNDAPALAKAHVGIAVGAAGSDVAIETADVVLMKDDLTKIPYLISLSKKTVSVVKQNVALSIIIKGSFTVLAIPGLVTLWLAVAVGDMGLSLGVIANALRIGWKK